ncbi:MAG: hypothetical protein N4A45_04495 [Flavobacteriales bacterium]|jgi:predicted metalloprotease with PDZ domain|nr:hypothetical protein [Flavobacteriales bacterium]
MQYTIRYQDAHRHFLHIEITHLQNNEDLVEFQLPSWRPGRYELGNFAKNIRGFRVIDAENKPLSFQKISKDRWKIFPNGSAFKIQYEYYANEVNAGSCFVDQDLFYVNPIQCCMYQEGKIGEKLSLKLVYPERFKNSLPKRYFKEGKYHFENFHSLVETPFMASETLTHFSYTCKDKVFNLYFQGVQEIPKERILTDFRKFTEKQLQYFGSLPVESYDFLFLITPFKSYHGVEHTENTVICLGPDRELFEDKLYREFLHISSHELYHCWNIKALRPAVMKPYRYDQENYSPLGFIYEGLTTYMGDLILWESGVFDDLGWKKCVDNWLKVHFENYGFLNYSVAESSWDTWLDGYQLGIPNRKLSIYQDGALCMLMIDAAIREHSQGKESLHTFMRTLYENKSIRENGYSQEDIVHLMIELGGEKAQKIIDKYIFGTEDYTEGLKDAFHYFGWKLGIQNHQDYAKGGLGCILQKKEEGTYSVLKMIEGSWLDNRLVAVGDEIHTKANLEEKMTDSIELKIKQKYREFALTFSPNDCKNVYAEYLLEFTK